MFRRNREPRHRKAGTDRKSSVFMHKFTSMDEGSPFSLSPSLSLCLSPFTHTHRHRHTDTHTQTHKHTNAVVHAALGTRGAHKHAFVHLNFLERFQYVCMYSCVYTSRIFTHADELLKSYLHENKSGKRHRLEYEKKRAPRRTIKTTHSHTHTNMYGLHKSITH
jgi:hypothetical protein